MKKNAALAAALAASMIVTVSASAPDISMKRLGKTAEYASSSFASTAELLTSRTVKNTLKVSSGEAFIVPAGKKLVLKNGCKIQGTLYIQQGGILSVSGGTMQISGTVVNDGTISVGSRAALDVLNGGVLYTSADGTFKSATNRITIDSSADVACLGSSRVTRCSSALKTKLLPKAVSGINTTRDTGDVVINSEKISAAIALTMVDVDYFTRDEFPAGSPSEHTQILFDDGSSIEFSFMDGKITCIGEAPLTKIFVTADLKDPVTNYSEKLAAAFLKKWKTISSEQSGMVRQEVSVFTYEMSDGSWLAAMIYPSYQSNQAVFYRLAGGKVTEIGSGNCGLELTVLKNGSDYILHSTSTQSFISGTNGATSLAIIDDYYQIGKKELSLLGSFESHKHGEEITYTGSLVNGAYADVSARDFTSLQNKITSGYKADCSANFDTTGDLSSDYSLEFTKSGNDLTSYIADRLYTPQRENVVYFG